MKRALAVTLVAVAFAAFGLTACGGKKYIQPPEERPGEVEEINPAVQETDERARYSVDVPIQ